MEKKKHKTLKKVILAVVVIVVAFAAMIIYFVAKDLKQEELLKQEIVNYSNKNLQTDEFPIVVKTTGDYAYVEEAVKKYYKNLSDNVKALNSYLKNDKLLTVLSPNSLKEDRPAYAASHEVIKSTKDKVNESLKNIVELCDEKTIKSLIDKEKLDDGEYYYDLYLKFMYTKKDKEELEKTRKSMEEVSKAFNEYLDKADQILTFLQANDSVIEYKGNGVYFSSNSQLEQYNKLVTELQDIANSMNNVGNEKENKSDSI